MLRLYPKSVATGIPVVFADPDAHRQDWVARIEEALRLLEASDPRNYRRVIRYTKQIAVWPGHYVSASPGGRIQLPSSLILDASTGQIASIFVHEAVHLRLGHIGIKTNGTNREQVERRCIKEQAAFLRRLGEDYHELAGEVEAALESRWWTHEAHLADVERLIAEVGVPRWIVPLLPRR